MKYFYIFGNICSILGFVAAIILFPEKAAISTTAKWLVVTLILLSTLFWLYFYFRPKNPIAKFIDSRIDFTGEYLDTSNQSQDIIEGVLEVNTSNWGTTVGLPPFEDTPTIRMLSFDNSNNSNPPTIHDVTVDSFKVKIDSSTQSGKWKWRARGKLLTKSNDTKMKNDL